MALIKWRDEFCTGISGVDHEHQQLIEQINTIFTSIDDNMAPAIIVDKLGEIYGNISAHFVLEEKMMEKHAYPHYDEHRQDHERLLDDIVDITEEFELTSEVNEQKFKQQLNDWFQGHFKNHDARLHRLAHLMQHDTVDEGTLQRMIQSAKNLFLRKPD